MKILFARAIIKFFVGKKEREGEKKEKNPSIPLLQSRFQRINDQRNRSRAGKDEGKASRSGKQTSVVATQESSYSASSPVARRPFPWNVEQRSALEKLKTRQVKASIVSAHPTEVSAPTSPPSAHRYTHFLSSSGHENSTNRNFSPVQ